MPPRDKRSLGEKFEPHDIIALAILTGCFILIPMGLERAIGGLIGNVMLIVVGFYFGRKSKNR